MPSSKRKVNESLLDGQCESCVAEKEPPQERQSDKHLRAHDDPEDRNQVVTRFTRDDKRTEGTFKGPAWLVAYVVAVAAFLACVWLVCGAPGLG